MASWLMECLGCSEQTKLGKLTLVSQNVAETLRFVRAQFHC